MKVDVEDIKKFNLNIGDVLVIRYNFSRPPVFMTNVLKKFKEFCK